MDYGNVLVRSELANRPEKPSVLSAIQSCSTFNSLSEDERDSLAASSFMAFAERGEFVWLAGSPIQFVSIIGSGFLKMTRTTPQGSDVAVELLGPGQCLGILAAIEGRVYPLNAVAVTNAWYLKVPTKALVNLYRSSSSLRDILLRSLGPRLRKAHDMMARMSGGKIEQRLSAVLLILMESYGETRPKGVLLTVPLTRQDLAEMAGTTIETTIRVMSKWQKAKVVSTHQQWITIHDAPTLESVLVT